MTKKSIIDIQIQFSKTNFIYKTNETNILLDLLIDVEEECKKRGLQPPTHYHIRNGQKRIEMDIGSLGYSLQELGFSNGVILLSLADFFNPNNMPIDQNLSLENLCGRMVDVILTSLIKENKRCLPVPKTCTLLARCHQLGLISITQAQKIIESIQSFYPRGQIPQNSTDYIVCAMVKLIQIRPLKALDELKTDFCQELASYKEELTYSYKKECDVYQLNFQNSDKIYRRTCHLKEFASISQEYSKKVDLIVQDATIDETNHSVILVIKEAEKLKNFLENYQTQAEIIAKKIEYDIFINSVFFFRKTGYPRYQFELKEIQAKIEKVPEEDSEEDVDEYDDDDYADDENEETNDLKLEVFNQKKELLIRIGQHLNWIPKPNLSITNCIVKKEKDFPDELWISIAGFLNKRDLDSLSFLNRNFALIAWQAMVSLCKDKFGCFPFSPVVAYDIQLLKNLNSTRKYFNKRYYTLFDPVYAELFEAIENKDGEKAQNFIQTQLKAKKTNVIDRVFYQKNSDGETAISLAGRYKLLKFLDFCFNTFIVEGHRLNRGANLLVKTGRYSEVMDELNYSMSNEALWIFACICLCKQVELYEDITQKSAWQRTWMDEKEPQSLAGMAILLSSYDLLKLTLEVVDGPVNHQEHIHNQVLREKSFHAANLYVTSTGLNFSPIEMAAFGKNQVIIDYIFGLMEPTAIFNSGYHNLLCYFIECKDLKGLVFYTRDSLNQDSDLFNRYLNVDSDHQLTPLGVAIAKNWMQGFKYLFMKAKYYSLDDEVFSHVT